MFPGPCILLLISLECLQASDEKAAFAIGTQPHIHFVQTSRGRMHGQQVDNALAQSQKENHVVERPFAARVLDIAAGIVQKDQIEI